METITPQDKNYMGPNCVVHFSCVSHWHQVKEVLWNHVGFNEVAVSFTTEALITYYHQNHVCFSQIVRFVSLARFDARTFSIYWNHVCMNLIFWLHISMSATYQNYVVRNDCTFCMTATLAWDDKAPTQIRWAGIQFSVMNVSQPSTTQQPSQLTQTTQHWLDLGRRFYMSEI